MRRTRRLLSLSIALAVLTLVTPSIATAAGGDLDPGFGSGGIVTTDISGTSDEAAAVAVAPDGKIVVAGLTMVDSSTDVAVVRYTSDGQLDPSFGGDGIVVTPVLNAWDLGFAVAIAPDGAIIVAAQAYDDGATAPYLLRYLDDGTLDPGFGTGGLFRLSFAGTLRTLAISDSGSILAGGARGRGGNFTAFVVKADRTGTLDASFGVGGVATVPGMTWIGDLALQQDNRILVTGSINELGWSATRLLPNGSIDRSYGGTGRARFPLDTDGLDEYFTGSVAVQPDQKAVLGGGRIAEIDEGSRGPHFAVARFTFNGQVDPTFSDDGVVALTEAPDLPSDSVDIDVASDGKIVLSGWGRAEDGMGIDMVIARFTDRGKLDRTFSGDGFTRVDISGHTGTARSAAISPDGIVVAGADHSGYNAYNADMAVVRLQSGALAADAGGPDLGDIASQRVAEGATLRFRLSAADPDHDRLSFWSDPLPRGAVLDDQGRFSWTPGYSQAGRYDLMLHVSDNYAEHTDTITVRVFVAERVIVTRLAQQVDVGATIAVNGRVTPTPRLDPDAVVEVELYRRRQGGGFELLAADSTPLDDAGRFTVSFDRPTTPATCRIVSVYAGAEPYQPSSATTTFAC